MTRDEAIEKIAKAMLRKRGQPEQSWQSSVYDKDFASNVVTALEALGLWEEGK
ncbi:MAG: hypothetical protein JWN71_4384 [Xanthobacteraceae bacterium]|nr:hypothetical protein [Xanthobacteraceae bacterium]